MRFTTIDVNKLELSDDRFRISYFISLEKLTRSIQSTGLINPPVLIFRGKSLIILSGWRRILACRQLSIPSIPVFIAEISDDLQAFKIPVYENLSVKTYSPVEKSEILYKLKTFGEKDESLLRQFLPLLDIPPRRTWLEFYMKVFNFKSDVKEFLHTKHVHLSVIQIMSDFSTEVQKRLIPLLNSLGQNKQKELLTDLYEISRGQKIPVEQLLQAPEIKFIQAEEKLSHIQKADKIRLWLKSRRNPALSAGKKAFNAILKELDIEQGIVISPAAFFEGEDISLNFSFKDREEFILVWEGQAKIGVCGENEIWGYETIGAVDFFYIGPNILHNVENTGEKILKYIYVVALH